MRCRFESGRDIKQAFGVVNPGQSIVTAVDGATVVGRAQADGMAMDVLMAVAWFLKILALERMERQWPHNSVGTALPSARMAV